MYEIIINVCINVFGLCIGIQGPVSRKTMTCLFCKAGLFFFFFWFFFFLVKLVKRLRFEDAKRIMSPEIRTKSFGTFEKWAPGLNFSGLSIT